MTTGRSLRPNANLRVTGIDFSHSRPKDDILAIIAERASTTVEGSDRGRTPMWDRFVVFLNPPRCIGQHRRNVLRFEVWVCVQDLFRGRPARHQPKIGAHRDTHAATWGALP